jgi:hypothetical protein
MLLSTAAQQSFDMFAGKCHSLGVSMHALWSASRGLSDVVTVQDRLPDLQTAPQPAARQKQEASVATLGQQQQGVLDRLPSL